MAGSILTFPRSSTSINSSEATIHMKPLYVSSETPCPISYIIHFIVLINVQNGLYLSIIVYRLSLLGEHKLQES